MLNKSEALSVMILGLLIVFFLKIFLDVYFQAKKNDLNGQDFLFSFINSIFLLMLLPLLPFILFFIFRGLKDSEFKKALNKGNKFSDSELIDLIRIFKNFKFSILMTYIAFNSLGSITTLYYKKKGMKKRYRKTALVSEVSNLYENFSNKCFSC